MRKRIFQTKWARLILALGIVLGLVLVDFQPARADGPLIPGYTLKDGVPIPAPTGYIQTETIDGQAQDCGPFLNPMDLFRDPASGNLLVADTGNNRVVVLDSKGKF